MSRVDAIVVGVGSMGAAACYYLARAGYSVLGLEQYDVVHDRGSHSGQSRIIRMAYFEHPAYVPLLERAYENWKRFEEETGVALYHETGIVYFGEGNHPTIAGVKQSAETHGIPLIRFGEAESAKSFPQINIRSSFETWYEPQAGFVTPERAVRAFADQAVRMGADIRTGEVVKRWQKDGEGVVVETEGGVYRGDRLILTAGAWTSRLVPALSNSLTVTRQTLVWLNPRDPASFALGNFPCWFVVDPDEGMFYGFPVLPFEGFGGPLGLKLASHRRGMPIDPGGDDRRVSAAEVERVVRFASRYLPDAGNEVIASRTCLYTYSPDENFIIDHLPGHEGSVVVACGFSGHGFKFVPAVGEILCDLAMKGRTRLDITFLQLRGRGVFLHTGGRL